MSQAFVADQTGISQAEYSRIERGEANASLVKLSAAAAVLGLDLVQKLYPVDSPMRDAGHLRVLGRLQALVPAGFQWATEVPIPSAGDLRAVDAMIVRPRIDTGFEVESVLLDAQALTRRALLKRRDSGLVSMIIVLPDTRHNRSAVLAGAPTLRASFPLESRAILVALRAGRAPQGNGILFV